MINLPVKRVLTDQMRAEIRRIFKTRPRNEREYRLIAPMYNVSWHTISKVVNCA